MGVLTIAAAAGESCYLHAAGANRSTRLPPAVL
ncbi:MAG: hypothetical protein QOI82_2120 [Actinomycetota bacterium]|jgi:hypothetical protein|nr:hypothetical protein [Actinomycetota bacterium]